MLHHFRENSCKFIINNENNKFKNCGLSFKGKKCYPQTCKKAIGKFNTDIVFTSLFEYSDIIFFSENYYIGKDDDKEYSQGGILSIEELLEMFKNIVKKWKFVIYHPDYLCPKKNEIQEFIDKIKPQIIMNNHIAFAVFKNSIKYPKE